MALEDNGIRLDVVSAVIDGDTAMAYIALTDLTGDRIDATIDLFDSAHINIPSECRGVCRLIDYDARTKSATFLIEISRTDGRAIDGEKVTFSLSKFLSHKREVTEDLTAYLANADSNPAMRNDLFLCGWGSGGAYGTFDQVKALGVMASDPKDAAVIAKDVALTKIGFIGGRLRVQTQYTDRLRNDNHNFLYLTNEAGDKIMPWVGMNYASTYGVDASRVDYQEVIFDVSPGEIGKYGLFADIVLSGMLTQGDWQITFPLDIANERLGGVRAQ